MSYLRCSKMRCKVAPAFSMVEAVMSVMIVGVMLVAALNTVGANAMAMYKMTQREKVGFLAESLLIEILEMSYEDETDPLNIGLESGESGSSRLAFDDVDDFDNWSGDAVDKAGVSIPGIDGFSRQVSIDWVTLADPSVTSAVETGLKRIKVVVSRNGEEILTVTALRTEAVPDPVVIKKTSQTLLQIQ